LVASSSLLVSFCSILVAFSSVLVSLLLAHTHAHHTPVFLFFLCFFFFFFFFFCFFFFFFFFFFCFSPCSVRCQAGHNMKSVLSYVFSYDVRDHPRFPTRGWALRSEHVRSSSLVVVLL
jgi:hypothetical protein